MSRLLAAERQSAIPLGPPASRCGSVDQAWLDARGWTVDLAGEAAPVHASLAVPLEWRSRAEAGFAHDDGIERTSRCRNLPVS